MYKKIFRSNLTTCLLASAILLSSSAQAALLNFDDGVANELIGDFYVAQGVSFGNAQRVTNFGLAGSSGPYGIRASNADAYQWFADNPVQAYFSGPVNSVSLIGVDVGENGLRLEAYDADVGGSLLDFVEAFGTGLGNNQFFTLEVNGESIKRVAFYQIRNLSIDGVVVEDLQFSNRVSVPVPASAVLMGMGLIGLRVLALKNKRT